MSSYHNLSRQSTIFSKHKGGSSILSASSMGFRTPSKFSGRQKKKKLTQSALVRRGHFRIIDSDGIERTPKLLYDPDFQVLEEWQPTVLDYVDVDLTSTGSQASLARNFQQSTGLSYGSRTSHTLSLQMSFSNIANVDSFKEYGRPIEGDDDAVSRSDQLSETAASAFFLKYVPSREFYQPHSKVPIVCKESDSITLFSLNSVVENAETPEGEATQEDNEFYEYITTGKGKYSRKLNVSEGQTPIRNTTTQTNYFPRFKRKNDWTWVTTWKIYDEYFAQPEEKKNLKGIPIEEQWNQLSTERKFITQALVMERCLTGAFQRPQQLIFKKTLKSNPLDLEVKFPYLARTLWTFHTDKVQKKSVSAISLNPKIENVIAVGYGKYHYKEADKGYICVWSIKNTKYPERFYKFSSSVTCLDFSTYSPNFLAAGFHDGSLHVLDVTSLEKKIMLSKDSIFCNTYDTVLFAKFFFFTNIFNVKEERLMMTTADGRIIQLRKRVDQLFPFQMMRIMTPEGKIKGIEYLRRCEPEEIPMLRFPGARCAEEYPDDTNFYLVSGDDGSVHKCSVNFFAQHTDVFLAHTGPVYALKFSPFCSKLFLTCGGDGAVRLWAWDIFEPLITLTIGSLAVQDAAWSPSNSTIIASISGPCLCIWDLRRKTYYPASTIYHPSGSDYCCFQFTKSGQNIVLGDRNGNVQVLALSGMPFDQFYKENVLAESIEKELIVKPRLLKLLKKSGPPFSKLSGEQSLVT